MGGNLKQGGNASLPQGEDAPACDPTVRSLDNVAEINYESVKGA